MVTSVGRVVSVVGNVGMAFKNFGSMENSYPIRCDLIDLIHQVMKYRPHFLS